MLDLLYCTYNRLEYAKASLESVLANTNWGLVRRLVWHDDASTDGTRELVYDRLTDWQDARRYEAGADGPAIIPCYERVGGPVAIMRTYLAFPGGADVFCKLDSDCVVPPGWLDAAWGAWRRAEQAHALAVQARPMMTDLPAGKERLDLLGIEGSFGRRPARPATAREVPFQHAEALGWGADPRGHEPAVHIGGVGLMRRAAFEKYPLGPSWGFNGVFGFTSFQTDYSDIVKGWLSPPVPLILLDRLPFEPWVSLGKEYEAKGWQRSWPDYDINADRDLWSWWPQSGDPTGAS